MLVAAVFPFRLDMIRPFLSCSLTVEVHIISEILTERKLSLVRILLVVVHPVDPESSLVHGELLQGVDGLVQVIFLHCPLSTQEWGN